MAEIEIYSAAVCPYAHRSRLTLLEKNIDFTLIEINLQNKPPGFTDISPYGKVPVIKHGKVRVWESVIINEYLDEAFPNPPLMPRDPAGRSIARIWIDFANSRFVPTFTSLLKSPDFDRQHQLTQELYNHLLFMEREGIGQLSTGVYWFGSSPSLVDLTFYPWFERWCVAEHYRQVRFPAECTRLQVWWEAMSQRETVKSIANSQEFYIDRYASYVVN